MRQDKPTKHVGYTILMVAMFTLVVLTICKVADASPILSGSVSFDSLMGYAFFCTGAGSDVKLRGGTPSC